MKSWFHRRGIFNLVEMQWWQESPIPSHPEYHVVATPAMVPTLSCLLLNPTNRLGSTGRHDTPSTPTQPSGTVTS